MQGTRPQPNRGLPQNVTADYQRKTRQIDNIIKMVQDKPGDISTVEVGVKQIRAMPQDVQQMALTKTLCAAAKAGDKAYKMTIEENKRLKQPPTRVVTLEKITYNTECSVASVLKRDGIVEVPVSMDVDCSKLVPGQRVALSRNESAVIAQRGFAPAYPTCEFEELLEDKSESYRILVTTGNSQTAVLVAGGYLTEQATLQELKPGDLLEYDPDARCVLRIVKQFNRIREFVGEAPDVTFADIGGLDEVWQKIELEVIGPLENPETYKRLRVNVPPGVLFYGPPGCGKTLLIKAIARRAMEVMGLDINAPVIFTVPGTALLRPYVGEGEALVRKIAQSAEKAADEYGFALVLLDDFEYTVLRRGVCDASSPAYGSLTNTLLSTMDGLGKRNRRFIWIATSNRPEIADSGALRAGRFGAKIEIRRPGFDACTDILQVHLNGVPLAKGLSYEFIAETVVQRIFSAEPENVLLRIVFANSEQKEIFPPDVISGAILANAVRAGAINAITRAKSDGGRDTGFLCLEDIMEGLDQQLLSTVSMITVDNVRDYYLDLPTGLRPVAVHHTYRFRETNKEIFIA